LDKLDESGRRFVYPWQHKIDKMKLHCLSQFANTVELV